MFLLFLTKRNDISPTCFSISSLLHFLPLPCPEQFGDLEFQKGFFLPVFSDPGRGKLGVAVAEGTQQDHTSACFFSASCRGAHRVPDPSPCHVPSTPSPAAGTRLALLLLGNQVPAHLELSVGRWQQDGALRWSRGLDSVPLGPGNNKKGEELKDDFQSQK